MASTLAPSAYDPCPCGSGKKFKFCCERYFGKIEQALSMQQQGQHASALSVMEQAAKENANQPPVWGYFAHLLYMEGQIDKAEEVLQKAFDLQPDFAMGHLLRGIFRQQEGEVIGALLLFRKAAESYDPAAHDQLAQAYEMIARNELMLNRPVAARAALERSVHFSPGDAELREQFQALFGGEARIPAAAGKKYAFRPTAKPVAVDAAATGRLSDAKKAYEALTTQVPDDPAAWFNLGLVRAWLGEQPASAEALNQSLEREWDDAKAEETAALLEVLKCGHGMEGESDYVENRVYMPLRDPETVFNLLQQMSNERKILAPQMDPNSGFFSCMVVEELPSLVDTGTTMARVTANLNIQQGILRLWHPSKESVARVASAIRDRAMLAVGEPVEGSGPAQFGDIVLEAIAYPVRSAPGGDAEQKLRDYARNYFENVWIHRPLKSLSGVPPVDAAGSQSLRKRLLGVVRFLEDCLDSAAPRRQEGEKLLAVTVYDFAGLRHKLGAELQAAGEAPTIHVPEDAKPAPKREWNAMSAADLAAVPATELSAADAEEAMRAALRLDARELAVAFARAGVAAPADPKHADRYPLYAVLITGALSDGGPSAALEQVEAGRKYDADHNGGARAGEFGVQKAKLLARSGDVDGSAAAFRSLIEAFPQEPKYIVTATEAMLSAKQGPKALEFAEMGLAKAKATGNRDLEGACLELGEAARRAK